MTLHIGITATREGLTGPQITTIKRELLGYYTIYCRDIYLHHGCCIGGDEQITVMAFTLGIKVCAHPPVNRKFFSQLAYDLSSCKNDDKPFLDRNQDIVNASNVLIGAPKEKYEVLRSGTWSTIRKARDGKDIQTVVIYADGEFDEYNV